MPPDGALLVASAIYCAVLITACFLQSSALRWIVAAATGMTLVYTPLLKRCMGLKNAVVAFVIAASPVTGALASGAVRLPALMFLSTAYALCLPASAC